MISLLCWSINTRGSTFLSYQPLPESTPITESGTQGTSSIMQFRGGAAIFSISHPRIHLPPTPEGTCERGVKDDRPWTFCSWAKSHAPRKGRGGVEHASSARTQQHSIGIPLAPHNRHPAGMRQGGTYKRHPLIILRVWGDVLLATHRNSFLHPYRKKGGGGPTMLPKVRICKY